ncbi:MAG: RIP metalloprotease RseP, partial [Alphaproteobacteria bacterium]
MEFLHLIWTNGASFLFILTVIIFVHEMGHYLIARRNGVRVEVFSIGFGREIFGKTDRLGTRWKISLLPFGGYVKMFGESAFSGAKDNTAPALTAEERKVSFYNKRLSQRAAIVTAGPLANFVLAVVILTVLFATAGQPFTPPNVGTVQSDSAAEEAGIQPGDLILRIEGTRIERFEQVRQIVLMNPGTPLRITVER